MAEHDDDVHCECEAEPGLHDSLHHVDDVERGLARLAK
jgi:hypothetical protein